MTYEIWINGNFFRSCATREMAEQDRDNLVAGWKANGIEVPAVVEIREKP